MSSSADNNECDNSERFDDAVGAWTVYWVSLVATNTILVLLLGWLRFKLMNKNTNKFAKTMTNLMLIHSIAALTRFGAGRLLVDEFGANGDGSLTKSTSII